MQLLVCDCMQIYFKWAEVRTIMKSAVTLNLFHIKMTVISINSTWYILPWCASASQNVIKNILRANVRQPCLTCVNVSRCRSVFTLTTACVNRQWVSHAYICAHTQTHSHTCIHERLSEIVMEMSVKSNQWQTCNNSVCFSRGRKAEGFEGGMIRQMKCVQNMISNQINISGLSLSVFPKTVLRVLILFDRINIWSSLSEKCFKVQLDSNVF